MITSGIVRHLISIYIPLNNNYTVKLLKEIRMSWMKMTVLWLIADWWRFTQQFINSIHIFTFSNIMIKVAYRVSFLNWKLPRRLTLTAISDIVLEFVWSVAKNVRVRCSDNYSDKNILTFQAKDICRRKCFDWNLLFDVVTGNETMFTCTLTGM